jgi:5-methylcytosine-specific restriction endonuclease McrA
LKSQRGRCAFCPAKLRSWHVDHRVALSKGGDNSKRNLQLLCRPCNLRKFNKDEIAFAQETGRLL